MRPGLRVMLGRKAAGGSGGGGGGVVTDSFNRPDSATSLGSADTGQAWSALDGTWGIQTHTAYLATGSSGREVAAINGGSANGTVQVDAVGGTDSGATLRLLSRVQDKDNYYECVLSVSGTFVVNRVVAGSRTQLSAGSSTFSAANTVKAVMSGGTITWFMDNGQFAQVTGETSFLTATKHGMGGNGVSGMVFYDNFSFTP